MSASATLPQALQHAFLRLIEKWFKKTELAPAVLLHEDIKRIVLILQPNRLIDLLLMTPVFRAVRQRFPDAHISVIARTPHAQILFHSRYSDEVICTYEHATEWSLQKILGFIRSIRTGFDLAIMLNRVCHSLVSDFLAHLTRAKFVLGSEDLVFDGWKQNPLYNLIAPLSDHYKHQVERNLNVVRYIDIDTADFSEEINLTEEEKNHGMDVLIGQGVDYQDFILGIHVGVGIGQDEWEINKYVNIAKFFSLNHAAKIIVSWGPDEHDLGRQFVNGLPFKPIEATGMAIREYAALVSWCNLFICSDIESMHLAASVKTPVIGLFGESDPCQWMPIGDQYLALRGSNGDCVNINENQVIEAAKKIIEKYPKSRRVTPRDFDISEQVVNACLDFGDISERI